MQIPIWSSVNYGFEDERIDVPLTLDPLNYTKAPTPKLDVSVTMLDTRNKGKAMSWEMSGLRATRISPYNLTPADVDYLISTYVALGKMLGLNE